MSPMSAFSLANSSIAFRFSSVLIDIVTAWRSCRAVYTLPETDVPLTRHGLFFNLGRVSVRFIGDKWTGQSSCPNTSDFPEITTILLLLHSNMSLPSCRLPALAERVPF
jgi:hypothetical protein